MKEGGLKHKMDGMYQMYTLPTCEHCNKAVEVFIAKQIPFEKINAGINEGMDRFKKFYNEHRSEIKRETSGTVVLPIVVYQNNGNLRIHQGREGLENFLEIK